jgi:hypothetical protein
MRQIAQEARGALVTPDNLGPLPPSDRLLIGEEEGEELLRAVAPEALDLSLNGSSYRLPRPDESGDYRIEAP